MKLYVYDHCPFCVRARMLVGLKQPDCEVIYLANDDEVTPVELIGKKMLPILVTDQGEAIGESMDIVRYLDGITGDKRLLAADDESVEAWINEATAVIFPLAVPRWAYSSYAEFRDLSARQYFIDKKQAFFGNFSALIKSSPALIEEVNGKLVVLESLLSRRNLSDTTWSETDILLFPVLRALTIVKGIVWPVGVDAWCKSRARQSDIPLNDDIAL